MGQFEQTALKVFHFQSKIHPVIKLFSATSLHWLFFFSKSGQVSMTIQKMCAPLIFTE